MKILTILSFLILCASAGGQTKKDWPRLEALNSGPFETEKDINGVCFIVPSDLFSFYERPLLVTTTDQREILRFEFRETLITTFHGKSYVQCDQTNPFKPWLFGCNPDYFNLAFECVDSTGNYYKIKMTDNEYALLSKRNRNFRKQEITDFVKEWTSLGLDFDRTHNPLRKTPSIDSRIINHADEKKYKIWTGESLDIKGDWIKIKSITGEIGWIRWRIKNKLLIRMYSAC